MSPKRVLLGAHLIPKTPFVYTREMAEAIKAGDVVDIPGWPGGAVARESTGSQELVIVSPEAIADLEQHRQWRRDHDGR